MFSFNTPTIFFTTPGAPDRGTDIYAVHTGGLIIAETDRNRLLVRPGQNLYFIRESDVDAFRLLRDPDVSYVNGRFFIFRHHDCDILLALTHDAFFNTPVHLSLNSDGSYNGGERNGHTVTPAFNGTCTAADTIFTLVQVLLAICVHWYDLQSGDYKIVDPLPLQLSYGG